MPISPVILNPTNEVALEQWRVFELQLPAEAAATRHIVARISGEGRVVTTPVIAIDWSTDLVTTRPATVYWLGKPGYADTSTLAFAEWLRANGVASETVRDVTFDVLAERHAARPPDVPGISLRR